MKKKLLTTSLVLGLGLASLYANAAVTYHEVSMPGGMVRLPLNYLFPSGYDFENNASYKFEVTLPKNNGNLYKCINNLIFNPDSHSCVLPASGLTNDYTYQNNILTIKKQGNEEIQRFMGQHYIIVPKPATVTVKITPL